jgi:hypothetical protein
MTAIVLLVLKEMPAVFSALDVWCALQRDIAKNSLA